ncbi:MAG: rod shape-determining protein MreD [Leptonema sp. (in: Bacteria)]|nr:rod shape-determining protein MreD [Leptonema sp. (in: bacteria)]
MILEFLVIFLGMIVSYFLKDMNFLSLQFDVLNTGIIYPDFLLIFVVFFALQRGEFSGLWIGFFAGLLEDSTILRFSDSTDPFTMILGLHSFAYTLLGFILGKMNRSLARENISTSIIVVFTSTLLTRLLVWLLMGIVNQFYVSYSFLSTAFYTAAISPIWFALLAWLYRVGGIKR